MGQVLGFVLTLHSLVRWVTVLVVIAALIKLALGWLRGGAFEKADRLLVTGFTSLMDTQMLLGLVFLFGSGLTGGGWPRERLEHVGLMVVAVVVSHLPARWKNQPDKLRFRNTLFAFLAALAIVVVAVATLPQGWFG